MICKVCSSKSNFLFEKRVLTKYQAKYYQCTNCLFIQTEEPFWLEEAYKSAITSLDIGLISRNNHYAPIVRAIMNHSFDVEKPALDYGGGYGMFVRLMRDKGLNFYRLDKYCENLFAKGFDVTDIEYKEFEIITAFEVFEHLAQPIEGINEMLSLGGTIVFSTELIPGTTDLNNWHYLVPEVGQHVSLYHYKTLKFLSDRFDLNLCSNGHNLHMLSKKKLNNQIFKLLAKHKASMLYNILFSKPKSLLESDFNFLRQSLSK